MLIYTNTAAKEKIYFLILSSIEKMIIYVKKISNIAIAISFAIMRNNQSQKCSQDIITIEHNNITIKNSINLLHFFFLVIYIEFFHMENCIIL